MTDRSFNRHYSLKNEYNTLTLTDRSINKKLNNMFSEYTGSLQFK